LKLVECNSYIQKEIVNKNGKIKELNHEINLLNLKISENEPKEKDDDFEIIKIEESIEMKNEMSLSEEILSSSDDEVKIEMPERKEVVNFEDELLIQNLLFRNKVHIITHLACFVYIIANLFSKYYE
jgi:hypothetical protein